MFFVFLKQNIDVLIVYKCVFFFSSKQKRKFEFVRVVKSNFHFSAGLMFLITFEVIDPYDSEIKPFQARVRYLNDTFTEYVFCRPKPNAGGLLTSLYICLSAVS